MKKKFISILCAILILATSLFSGALAETDLAGAWDDDYDELSLVFDGEGGVVLSDEWDSVDFVYEWDGENLTIADVDGEAYLVGLMDAEGDLVFEELEGYFYRVDEAYYIPELGWDGYSLPGTEWELEGSVFDFSWDGSILMDGEYVGAYYWDGEQTAEMHVDEATVLLLMDESPLRAAWMRTAIWSLATTSWFAWTPPPMCPACTPAAWRASWRASGSTRAVISCSPLTERIP